MSPEAQALVRTTWREVEPRTAALAPAFYRKLFELDPAAERLFGGTDMAAQERKVMEMFGALVAMLGDERRFVSELAALGRRHAGYGARHADYESVGAALMAVLEDALGDGFTPEVADAWAEGYRLMAGVMRRAGAVRQVPGRG